MSVDIVTTTDVLSSGHAWPNSAHGSVHRCNACIAIEAAPVLFGAAFQTESFDFGVSCVECLFAVKLQQDVSVFRCDSGLRLAARWTLGS